MDNATQLLSCYAVSGARGTATKALFWVFHPVKKLFRIYAIKDNASMLLAPGKVSVLIAIFAVLSATASSQSLNGVYLTKADFEKNLLSNPSSIEGDWLKVNYNQDVMISRNGLLTRFKHHQVYGYFAEGHKHIGWGSRRKFFSNAGYYKVLDTAGLIVLQTRVRGHKFSHDRYVYCRTLDGEKKLLTLRNLSKDFAYHPSFIQTIKSIERPYRLHRMVDGMTLLNRIYNEMVKPVEENWPKRIVRSGQPHNEKANGNGVSSRDIALASFYYQWYQTK